MENKFNKTHVWCNQQKLIFSHPTNPTITINDNIPISHPTNSSHVIDQMKTDQTQMVLFFFLNLIIYSDTDLNRKHFQFEQHSVLQE